MWIGLVLVFIWTRGIVCQAYRLLEDVDRMSDIVVLYGVCSKPLQYFVRSKGGTLGMLDNCNPFICTTKKNYHVGSVSVHCRE